MGITERDKKLLYVLGLIVIVALFFVIGIRPLNQRINKLEKKIAEAQELHDTIKMKLFQLDMLETFRVTCEEKVRELSSGYYEKMLPAEVDRLITDRALRYGLRVNNLRINTAREPVNLLPYVNSEAWKEEKEALLETEEAPAASDESVEGLVDVDALASIHADDGIYAVTDTTAAEVYATTMELDVAGDVQQERRLLDELIKNESMRVLSYEWTDMTSLPYQYVNGELTHIGGENGRRLVVRFDLYMYDGSDYAALTDQ
ncbi:MAG: type II secretion system protein M [Lachnospiraceae bacterium]|nr:type II secretion system protein M [Lachnospiraceae bacterium]